MGDLVEARVVTWHGPLSTWLDGDGDHVIVLLHGLGGDHDQALGFTPPAAELDGDGRRWRRLAVDMRAHGATAAIGAPNTLTFAAFAQDVEAISREAIAASGRPLIAIVGMSMGAEVALHVVARSPELALALVLIRPAFAGGAVPSQMLPCYQLVRDYLQRSGPVGVEAFVETEAYQEILRQSPQAAQSLRRQFARPDAVERSDVLTAIPTSAQLPIDTLRRLTLPTLVIASPNDPAHPLACADLLANVLPDARPLVIVAEKQVDPGEHERELRDATSEFLRSIA
jgi:pimeloyl-ACP methyl ester carboxylesterase